MTDLESSAIIGGITQMGARVYLPILGRFLQVDPVEGGGDNTYVYVNDPVNEDDLDGNVAPLAGAILWHLGRIAVQQTVRVAAKHAAKHAVKHVAKKTAVYSTKKVAQRVAQKRVVRIPHNARGYKTSKQIYNRGRYQVIRWTVNAKNAGPPARAVYTKIRINGRTRAIYKDTYNKNNRLIHRKYKVCRGRKC